MLVEIAKHFRVGQVAFQELLLSFGSAEILLGDGSNGSQAFGGYARDDGSPRVPGKKFGFVLPPKSADGFDGPIEFFRVLQSNSAGDHAAVKNDRSFDEEKLRRIIQFHGV